MDVHRSGSGRVEGRAPGARGGRVTRVAGWVGDLGSPFYAEERQRDVWNEACAVGYQLMTWLGLVAATVAVWVGGTAALPYAVLLLGVVGSASWLTLLYARSLGVDAVAAEGVRLRRWRMLPFVLLLAALVGGVLHASPGGGFLDGLGWGALVGALAGLSALAVARWRVHRDAGGDA